MVQALAEFGAVDPRAQAMVVLHWMGGLTVTEIAHRLGESDSRVSQQITAARGWFVAKLHDRPPPRERPR